MMSQNDLATASTSTSQLYEFKISLALSFSDLIMVPTKLKINSNINDFGARPEDLEECSSSSCNVIKKQQVFFEAIVC